MEINYSRNFIKQFSRLSPKIKEAFKTRLKTFLVNKTDPLLNNHPLRGKLDGCRSINVTGDYRAIFEEFERGRVILFSFIGNHDQLYKK